MTPIQVDCSSQSSNDIVPSPPLSGKGRLTSVDEGVVLESSSDSTNSREKLASHLEYATEELEAENKWLYDRNEELRKRHIQTEEEKSKLTLKVLEQVTALETKEKKLQQETADVIYLQIKVEEKVFETCELPARLEQLEDELQAKVQLKFSLLKENERQLRGQLSEERKHFEDLEEQNAKLKLKFKHLEDRFEENELKLASYTKSESLDSNKVMKQLESLIAENKTLNLRIFQLQGELTEKSDISSAKQNETGDLKFTEDQNKNLERKIIDLEVKLKEQQVKILSVKEYERRLRAELCKEMTKKLTKAQTRSRELGEKILELEANLLDAEQHYNSVQCLNLNTRSDLLDNIRALKENLQYSESRNKELNLSVQVAEERLRLSQREVLLVKQSQIDLRENVQLLKSENCRIQDELRLSKEERRTRLPTGRTTDRLEKLRKENANLSLELKSLTENILKLESDLLRKDEEILTRRNESVDLSSEVCKLTNELDGFDVLHKADELKKSSEPQSKLASRLFRAKFKELRRSKMPENDRVAEVVDGRSDSTGSTLLISDVNFELAVNSESTESFLEKPDNSEFVGDSQMDRNQLLKEQKQLLIVIGELQNEKSRMADRNEKFLQVLKTLQATLSIFESPFCVCRSENECLQQEVNIKSAEANTVRTYASFCSEKANELRLEMAFHRENEGCLEKRLCDLEKESAQVRNEMGHGMLEFSELKEKTKSLEKKTVDASCVVDHLKQEIVGLVNGMLTLQREPNVHMDRMSGFLGLDEKSVQHTVNQLPVSVESNDISTQTKESGSEVSSEPSEVFLSSSPFTFRLLPDKEGFFNPSDVSVIRHNKTEILRLHDELKAEVLAIKDFLDSDKGSVAKVDDERSAFGEKSVQHTVNQLPVSVESNDISTQTKESGSEVSSEPSEVFLSSSPFTFRLLPDKEGFFNPSDVSVIRHNKTEILRLHDELKAEVLAIKDFLDSDKGSMAKVDDERSGEAHTRTNLPILLVGPKNASGLPRLSKAERVKVSSSLSRFYRTTKNDGRSSGDGNDLCLLYDNLENEFSRLSCELLTRENGIAITLRDYIKLHTDLEQCEKGLMVFLHCNCKVSPELEANRKQHEGSLNFSQAQDTPRLESEICDFMEYRQRLEGEFDPERGER